MTKAYQPSNLEATVQSTWLEMTPARVAAAVIWAHGAQKLFGLLGRGPVEFLELRWFAGILEFVGPFFIGLGLFTRPVAFLLSGEMACAYFIAHFSQGFWPIVNQGERAVLFCLVYLFLATTGPGKLALDNILFHKKAEEE